VAAARILAAQGAAVFLTYYRESCDFPATDLEAARIAGRGGPALYRANRQCATEGLVTRIRADGGKAAALELELRSPGKVPLLFDSCADAVGEIDILINNHTYCEPDTFDPDRVTEDGFGVRLVDAANSDASFTVNSRAYALLMVEFVRRYRARQATWGRIINLSTDAAHAHTSNVSHAASKHAIESYSRSAALELGRYGITVNIVAPGPIQTGYLTPAEEVEIAVGTPLGRVGAPDDVARVIAFLASDQAAWLTGQLLYAGGGWRMHQ
jgi:3-oxoacyl-[acyl-carrier protein] reductase